ncbi:MAG: RHS repeat-associated core domain-containing protein [Bacteroidetes bacterium]|nr:RHS repeat-associated core domain-containing protein [Bacteroidota bacterium]
MCKKIVYLICALFFIQSLSVRAADDQVIASLSGSNIKALPSGASPAYSLFAEDQQYSYMLNNRSEWPYRFGVKRNLASVVLRFDDSKRNYINSALSFTVNYDIALYDMGGSGSSPNLYSTLTGQKAIISYNAASNYNDIFLQTYEGAYRAEVKITSINFVLNGTTLSTIPSNFDGDLFFDVIQETERYYDMRYVTAPHVFADPSITVTTPVSGSPVTQAALATYNNQVPIAWNYVQGAESYDVEWTFIDVGNAAFGTGFTVDFSNASRINTAEQHYSIPMSYPKGTLIYRVRPVGRLNMAPYDTRAEGPWSVSLSSGTTIANLSAIGSSAYRIDFSGLDMAYNWQSSTAFAEEGKRKEVISYFDGSLRNRQTATVLNSDNNAVVAETKYDFQGRPTVQLLPTPLTSTGIHYYSNFNPTFDKNDFDADAAYPGSGPTSASTVSGNKTADYYGNNTSATGTDAYIPDAQGTPYAQTIYKTDGTGRVSVQTGVGPDHKFGTGHETRYYYGTPGGQEELDRLFGDEVGSVSHYKKNMISDANGQLSVTYLDQEGRTIATALAGNAPANLLSIDKKPAATSITVDMLTGKNNLLGNGRIATTTILNTMAGSDYKFAYALNLDTACQASPCPLCKTCVYDLQISVKDENGNYVTATTLSGSSTPYAGTSGNCTNNASGSPIINCNNITAASYQFTVNLAQIGTYYIEKNIVLNQGQLDNYKNDFFTAIQTSPCGPLTTPVSPPPCDNCVYLCNKEFGVDAPTYLSTSITIPVTDKYGNPYSELSSGDQAIARNEYTTCVNNCQNPVMAIPSECDLRHMALAKDMSPYGQYFDNLVDQPNTCSGAPLSCSPNNPSRSSTCANDWLVHNVSTGSFWSNFSTWLSTNHAADFSGGLASSDQNWDYIRAHWKDYMADYLITFHPEYCAYTFYCGNLTVCSNSAVVYTVTASGTGTVSVSHTTMADSRLYDQQMISDQSGQFYNPYAYLSGSGTTPNAYISDLATTPTTLSTSYNGSANPEHFDPILGTDCNTVKVICGATQLNMRTMMQNYLKQFYTATASSAPTSVPMSIWYILDDPDNIATTGVSALSGKYGHSTGTTIDQATVDFFRSIHGYGGAPGILSNATKAEVFKNAYLGYKKFILYALYNTAFDCSGNRFVTGTCSCSANIPTLSNDPAEPGFMDCSASLPHAQIRIQQDPIYAAMLGDCPNFGVGPIAAAVLTATASEISNDCQASCAGDADNWIQEIRNRIYECNPALTLSSGALQTTLDHMRADMINICVHTCDANNQQGLDTYATGIPADDGSGTLHSFNEIYNHYLGTGTSYSGCTTIIPSINIVQPPADNSPGTCSCEKIKNYAIDHGITWVSNTNLASDIAASMNTVYGLSGGSALSASDVCTWLGNCFESTTSNTNSCFSSVAPLRSVNTLTNNPTGKSVPSDLWCLVPAGCTCDNLHTFALNNGITWVGNSSLSGDLATAINSVFELSGTDAVSSTDVCVWLTNCFQNSETNTNSCFSSTTPLQSITTLTNNPTYKSMPTGLWCPDLATGGAADEDPCQQDVDDAGYATQLLEQQADNAAAVKFIDNFRTRCLNKLLNDESLLATYDLNEYYYTLYYYDQAGNLIKTVPPEGVRPITVSQTPSTSGDPCDNTTANVRAYRQNNTNPFIWPLHGLVTNYKYTTLNQVREQTVPDHASATDPTNPSARGYTNFWYDKVGRLVVSQNERQKGYSGDPGYSYTKYDDLSRITEVGEKTNSTAMSDAIAKDDAALGAWLSSGPGRQVTMTYYDEAPPTTIMTENALSFYGNGQQGYLRNRVSCSAYFEDPTTGTYDNASHYSYDMHGNVKTLFTDINDAVLVSLSFNTARVDYDYDLVSGKVNQGSYNSGKPDQFFHRYNYDADNRITSVYTSRNGTIWEKESKYFYYKHGPLSRSELGDKEVQGSDYAYTIHGWIKGVNSAALSPTTDIGKDAYKTTSSQNLHSVFAADGYAYSLGYYDGDYVAKHPTTNALDFRGDLSNIKSDLLYPTTITSSGPANLYNGNIANMASSIYDNTYHGSFLMRAYRYDQLNRIKKAWATDVFSATSNIWDASNTLSSFGDMYYEEFKYDFNGNITDATRFDKTSTEFDKLTYNYITQSICSGGSAYDQLMNNKLDWVQDGMGITSMATDIDDQGSSGNYAYDNIGNLVMDKSDKVDNIDWTVYGKIKSVTHQSGSGKDDVEYVYDASGNRIAKIVKPSATLADPNSYITTYYRRDAQGNVMATYRKTRSGRAWLVNLEEQDIYGSSRVGLVKKEVMLYNHSDVLHSCDFNSTDGGWSYQSSTMTAGAGAYKNLEVDIAASTANAGVYLTPSSVTAGVTYEINFDLAGFAGQSVGDAGVPGVFTPGMLILTVTDNTSSLIISQATLSPGHNSWRFTPTGTNITIRVINSSSSNPAGSFYLDNMLIKQVPTSRTLGDKRYELSNHLGNVLTTISDRHLGIDALNNATGATGADGLVDNYMPEILSSKDYYAFGAPLDSWGYAGTNDYRYGMNGKEKDDEIKGSGNSYDFGARINDPRLGKWLSVDPLAHKYPWQSPYASMDNNPIANIDPTGMGTEDFVKDKAGNIRWDKDANSQATTKEGETYLGKDLTFTFNSYIDGKLWDGPNPPPPINGAAGDKLTTTIKLTATENDKGELTGLSATKNIVLGKTPIGKARDYYPGKGGSNNVFAFGEAKNTDGTLGGFSLNFEQHASVSPSEELGLNALGYKIVDVAQKLNITYGGGKLKVTSYTNIFPSATLDVRNSNDFWSVPYRLMHYPQPSFTGTHAAPVKMSSFNQPEGKDFSYYPSMFYKR